MEGYKELALLEYNEAWFRFIYANRIEGEMIPTKYDLIYDRMADGLRNLELLLKWEIFLLRRR